MLKLFKFFMRYLLKSGSFDPKAHKNEIKIEEESKFLCKTLCYVLILSTRNFTLVRILTLLEAP